MDYLTKYYKNLTEELQEKIVFLKSQLDEVVIYDQSKDQGIKDVQSFGKTSRMSDQRRIIPDNTNAAENSNFNPLIDDRFTAMPDNQPNPLSGTQQQPGQQQTENPLATDDRFTGSFEGEERESLGMPQMKEGGSRKRTTAEMLLGKKPVVESFSKAMRSKNPERMKKEMMRQAAKSAARSGMVSSGSEEDKMTALRIARNEILNPDFESRELHPDTMSDPQQREMMTDISAKLIAQDTTNRFISAFERAATERKQREIAGGMRPRTATPADNHDTDPTDSKPVHGVQSTKNDFSALSGMFPDVKKQLKNLSLRKNK